MKFDSIALQEEIKGLSLKQAVIRLEETKPEFKKLDNAWRMDGGNMPQNRQNRYSVLRHERRLLMDQIYKLRMPP